MTITETRREAHFVVPALDSVNPAAIAAKRAFDLVVGIPLCLLAVPVIGALALVLAVHHRANPFFVHDRIGRAGATVRVPKLRTLCVGHDPFADKTVACLEPSSRFTALLRRTHLDELPQLFLVPLGHLSLVGPRPRMESEAAVFGEAMFDQVRTSVPQGCSGLWQISHGLGGRVSDHPEYDLFYVEHRTLRLDLWILWRTAGQLVGGKRVALDDVPRWLLRSPVPATADAA